MALVDVLACEALSPVDDFNYTSNPISAGNSNWTDSVSSGDPVLATIDSGGGGPYCLPGALTSDCTAFWNPVFWGTKVVAVLTMLYKGTENADLGLGFFQGAGLGSGTPNGYWGELRIRSGTDEFRCRKVDAGVDGSLLTSGNLQETASGDKIAVTIIGATIEMWWKSGSTWTSMFSVTDVSSPYTSSKKAAIKDNGIDDFRPWASDFKVMTINDPPPYNPWPQRAPILAQ